MVEKQDSRVNINDTGDLSKDDNKIEDLQSYSGEREVTDYWDISGAMEHTPEGSNNTSGKMKLQGTADETLMAGDAGIKNETKNLTNDKVEMTADENRNAIKTSYCENGPSAINEKSLNMNINTNNLTINNNNANNNFAPAEGIVVSHDDSKDNYILKNPDAFVDDTKGDNRRSNGSAHQREHDTVGTEHIGNKKAENDVSDIVSENIETSPGAKDNCNEDDNKAPMSIREEMMLDAECAEDRFRIDRKKLEQMLLAATEGRGQSGEEFFQKIMDDTKTYITWPSKLKIGAKSKKDPHIRICGKPDNIKEAKQRIMLSLDTKSNRVTIKMDVSHTEHSHVIGKGGNNIKRVMQETGCHIHFPDSNRNNAGEKSNQVSITGHPEGVENARLKIRNLLPIVLQFEIPNAGMPMPDLNSPMIQHLVQVYGISIQFKQRAKVYSTSCTIRGSSDNVEGLKTGIQTLMSHVSGGQLPVTTQIEIAPQHHAYMLSKTGLNVTSIMQGTGARIIFPDPNALPKKSTVYISGTIDSVILARHKLMGCLPLLLMFDMKIDTNTPSNNDTSIIAHLMETLDVSINLKSKPKQPSRTVIIKSIEYNIYNMFESRAKLLGLESNSVTRPARSTTPKLTRNASIPQNAVSPVILLAAHSHVSTPTVQTHVISLTEPKAVTPLSGVVFGGPGYVITHTVPSNPATPRPLSAALVRTPSHSPYPTLPTQNGMQHHGQSPLITKTAKEVARNQEEINSTGYPMIDNNKSSPTSASMLHSSPSQNDARYQVNVTSPEEMQRRIDQRLGVQSNANVPRRNTPSENFYNMYNHGMANNQSDNSRRSSQNEDYDATMRQKLFNFNNNHIPKSEHSYEDNRVMLSPSSYDLTSNMQNNNFSRNSLQFNGEYQKSGNPMQPITSMSQLINNHNERYNDQNMDLQQKMNEHLLRQTAAQYGKDAVLPDQNILRQHLGIQKPQNPMEMQNDVGNHMRMDSTLSNSSRQSLGQGIRSPDSVGESRTSLNSDRNSPMSTISDRYTVSSNPRLGAYDQFEEPHQSPSPTNHSTNYQSLASQDINSLSPMNHHRSPPQIVLNQSGQFESNHLSENTTNDLNELYNQQNQNDMGPPGPPPGFEGFTPAGHAPHLKSDYQNLYKLAKKAMENKPVTSEVRTPTDIWAGWGFSKSMPFEMKEELQKLAASKGRYRNHLPTTYENGDEGSDRNQPSPVNEEDEYGLDGAAGSRLRVPLAREVPSLVGKSNSSLNAWRRRRLVNMNLSLGGNMGLNYMSSVQRPPPQKLSAFTPINPNESLNRSSNSPKANPSSIPESIPVNQSRAVVSSPFSKSGNEQTLHIPLPEKSNNYDPRSNMSSTPTIQDSLGLNTTAGSNNKVEADIPDVLNRLGLSKYISVFQQQEVDYQTFLTLTEPDLKELGISTFGPRKKILLAIKDLNKDRDVFSGSLQKDAPVHENLSDQMLQLQRLQLQQHRDNPQTTTPARLDSHSLLSSSRQLFNTQAPMQNHLDVPSSGIDRTVFQEDSNRDHHRMRSSRLWQNPRTGVSNSGRW